MSVAELQSLEREYAMPTYVRNPVQFVRGSGVRLWDAEDNEYLDFLAGISVLNVGHCHPRVVQAIREQAGRLSHVSNLYYTEPAMKLSAALSESSLGGKVFLCNSGAEANEAAIKLVRRARPGGNVVVLEGAFHGRTYGALSATPQETKQAPFAPLVPGFVVVPRDPGALAAAVDDRTAAVLLEPIQGETGIHVLSDDLLAAAREACDRTGAALVFDEIQTGHGTDRDAVGLRANRRGAGRFDQREGARRRPADRRARHRPAAGGCAAPGRSRLDVRRRSRGGVGGARRARDLLGSRAAGAGAGCRRAACIRARDAAVRDGRPRARAYARDRRGPARSTQPSWPGGRCWSSGWW